MKPAETEAAPVTTTQSSQWSQRLRWWAAFFRGSEAPFGFSLREWTVLGIVIYMGFLLVQFGLGMGINLFITIPEHYPGASASNFVVGFVQSIVWGIAHGPLLLAIHIVVGLIVLVHPIMVAVQLPPFVPSTRWPTMAAALCVVAAAASGAAYLTYHQDVFSLLMALGFGGAMLCYAITLYRVSRPIDPATKPTSWTDAPSGLG
jgi:hypothetical protein